MAKAYPLSPRKQRRQTMWMGMTPEERFWRHVDRSGGPDACWPWMGLLDRHGYGRCSVRLPNKTRRQQFFAHRYAIMLDGRALPPGKLAIHLCDNPRCTNPKHLSIGTHWDNNLDAALKGRSPKKWLDLAKVEKAKELRRAGAKCTEIAKKFGVDDSTVSRMTRGLTYKGAIPTLTTQNKSVSPPAKVELTPS